MRPPASTRPRPANHAVIDYVRRASPFAHSGFGSRLIALGKAIPGRSSCGVCTCVVLHDPADRIFAIAYGMREIVAEITKAAGCP